IGFYTGGCIKNSSALPRDGVGYQVIRLSRERFYGHPELLGFIRSLAKEAYSLYGATLLIGDLSQKNGGPMPDGHSSHQVGLDADILFWQHPVAKERKLTLAERELIEPISLLNPALTDIDPNRWSSLHARVLNLAASFSGVERIFVNPVIKKRLCEMFPGQQWLSKVRPWWGHDGHFHVRLRCPDDNALCEPQEPVTEGIGCGDELAWWLTPKVRRQEFDSKDKPSTRIVRKLPDACLSIVY
ncbi:MAG: penicillin-insensitive murein endopeptidase, partial [Deltaproteobacteria bacterium]|nr:penicillin-insensitive murein endopeptidase [Deltaproteobacteria bacterium]